MGRRNHKTKKFIQYYGKKFVEDYKKKKRADS